MGKVTGGIFGPVRGKVGGVVFSRALGGDTVRAYSVPSNPRTAAQQANRGVFGNLGRIGSDALGSIIQPLWDGRRTGMSGYNAFVQENKNAMGDTFDASALTISQGDQPTPEPHGAAPFAYDFDTGTGFVEVTTDWLNSIDQAGSLYIMYLNTETNRVVGTNVVTADSPLHETQLPTDMDPADLYVYIAYLDTSKAEIVLARDASGTLSGQVMSN